jgi:hypothetical protein
MNEAAAAPTRFGMYSRANLAKTRMKKDIHEVMLWNIQVAISKPQIFLSFCY